MTEPKSHPRAVDVNGEAYLRDAKGALVPLAAVKAIDLLMDEAVDTVIGGAISLSDRIRRFKSATFAHVLAFQEILAQEYDTKIGGTKGNITLTSFDGCRKLQIQVADLVEFGPELQAAKALIDECLLEWAAGSGVEIRALVNRVFSVDRQGQINRGELFMLLRVEIEDDRWKRAMDAIRGSIRVIGSKTYVRFYQRSAPDAAWSSIPLDIAVA